MSKRVQLVCQHLENISRAALEEHQKIIREFIRGRQGVYALYRKEKLYYVGLATNLRNRLKHHLRDKHGHSWDRFSVYLTIGAHHLRELESLMVRVMQPKGNKQKGKFARSENLRRRFRRAMRLNAFAAIDELMGQTRVSPLQVPSARNGRDAVLSKFITHPMKIRARCRGKFVTARVRRDGLIRLNGKLYTSPSLAGKAARGGNAAVNGWFFWTYERAPGDWVLLNELRR